VSVIDVHDGEFVRVQIPASLERSLHLALGGVHAPFFTLHEGTAVVVILRREEWEHLAPHFASAQPAAGFRLVSVHPVPGDTDFPARLTAALAAAGISARLLPSFHNDHLLVADDELDRTLAAIRHLLEGEQSR
jgi:hypothetical protein